MLEATRDFFWWFHESIEFMHGISTLVLVFFFVLENSENKHAQVKLTVVKCADVINEAFTVDKSFTVDKWCLLMFNRTIYELEIKNNFIFYVVKLIRPRDGHAFQTKWHTWRTRPQ